MAEQPIMAELPHADANALLASTSGAPIVFLDYDGTLAPIVISQRKRSSPRRRGQHSRRLRPLGLLPSSAVARMKSFNLSWDIDSCFAGPRCEHRRPQRGACPGS